MPEQLIPLALIDEPPHQLRDEISEEDLGELADDIACNGLLQAIGVQEQPGSGRFTIGYGHRRYLAHVRLRREAIRARIYPATVDLVEIAISENRFRKDLNPIEDAKAMRALLDRGKPLAYVSRLYRCSAATVDARLRLLAMPADIQRAIAAGQLSVSVASALSEVDHDSYRGELIEEAIRHGASARVVNVWVATYQAGRERIIENHETVRDIIRQAESYVVMVRCELHGDNVPITETVGLRPCRDCYNALMEEIRSAQPASSTAS